MTSLGWFKKLRLNMGIKKFCLFVDENQDELAFQIYDSKLLPLDAFLPNSIKALYYLTKWKSTGENRYINNIKALPHDSNIRKILESIQAENDQLCLVKAVKKGEPLQDQMMLNRLEAQDAPLIRLGLAMLSTICTDHPDSDTPLDQQMKNLLTILPTHHQLPEITRKVRNRLWAYVAWNLGKYENVLDNEHALEDQGFSHPEQFKKVLSHLQGVEAIKKGDIKTAIQKFDALWGEFDEKQNIEMSIVWGFMFFETDDPEKSVAWLSFILNRNQPAQSARGNNTLELALAIAMMRCSKTHQALLRLENLSKALSEETTQEAPLYLDPSNSVSLLSQICYLRAIAGFKNTLDWPVPNFDDAQENQKIILQNKALWKDARALIFDSISFFQKNKADDSWKGFLLEGFLAFVERGTVMNIEQVRAFSSAVEYIQSRKGRQRLKTIEGALITRANAVEEAQDLLVDKNYKGLERFYSKILEPLGEAIPARIRAAVCLSLWEQDPSRNILGELKQIGTDQDSKTILNKCIEQVQSIHLIKQLTAACRKVEKTDQILPSIEPLAGNPRAHNLCRIAVALTHLYNGKWQQADTCIKSVSDPVPEYQEHTLANISFYIAWKTNDLFTCQSLTSEKIKHLKLNGISNVSSALTARLLLVAIENRKENETIKIISQLCPDFNTQPVFNLIFSLIKFLVASGKISDAGYLTEMVDTFLSTQIKNEPEPDQRGFLMFAGSLVHILSGRYNAAIEILETLLSDKCQEREDIDSLLENTLFSDQCLLLKIQCELAIVCAGAEDMDLQWPALRRSLEKQSKILQGKPSLADYGHLLMGMVTFLSADILVDEATIENLAQAQLRLNLMTKNTFIEKIIGSLNWRQRVLNDFWVSLSHGNFEQSRAIYQKELEPAFGKRMPDSIKLGMVIADWDLGEATTSELLKTLSVLEHDAPELNKDMIAKVKNYILDGDKIKNLTQLLKEKDFDLAIEFIQATKWAGFEKGAMPVAVAVVLLFSYFKLRKTDHAINLGTNIGKSEGLSDWVKDYSNLLYGYVLYENAKFKESAEVFGKITRSAILEHNLDKYWAASHLSNGLQLLDVDKKEDAFEAFTQSLSVRGDADSIDLAPLFIHFGLKNIDMRQGSKALQAFELLSVSLKKGDSKDPLRFYYQLLSDLGKILVKSLLEDDDTQEIVDENDCLRLIQQLESKSNLIDDAQSKTMERALRIMAICQLFRSQRRVISNQRKGFNQLAKFTKNQISHLESEETKPEAMDPVLLALKGIIEIKSGPTADMTDAIEWITVAVRLGVRSPRLMRFLEQHRELQEKLAESRQGMLDFIDLYLSDSGIPIEMKSDFIRSDELEEVYRVTRKYMPEDIVPPSVSTGSKIMIERLTNLVEQVKGSGLKNKELKGLCQKILRKTKEIKTIEEELLTAENKILYHIAESMNTQAAKIKHF